MTLLKSFSKINPFSTLLIYDLLPFEIILFCIWCFIPCVPCIFVLDLLSIKEAEWVTFYHVVWRCLAQEPSSA